LISSQGNPQKRLSVITETPCRLESLAIGFDFSSPSVSAAVSFPHQHSFATSVSGCLSAPTSTSADLEAIVTQTVQQFEENEPAPGGLSPASEREDHDTDAVVRVLAGDGTEQCKNCLE
jgi:hypothetical protein